MVLDVYADIFMENKADLRHCTQLSQSTKMLEPSTPYPEGVNKMTRDNSAQVKGELFVWERLRFLTRPRKEDLLWRNKEGNQKF